MSHHAEEILILRPQLKRKKKTEVEKLLSNEIGILPKHSDRANRRKKKNSNQVENDAVMSSTMQPKVPASINLMKKVEQNSMSAVVNMLNTNTQSRQMEFKMHAWAVYNIDEKLSRAERVAGADRAMKNI